MSLICEFCKKTFATKRNLIKHQKSAKYCINIQQEGKLLNDIKQYKCYHCDKIFTDKNNMIKHELNCQTKLLNKIDKLTETVANLENKLSILKEENKII